MKHGTPERARLRCPACRTAQGAHPLGWHHIQRQDGERVIDGTLACVGCRHEYAVADEVAVLIPDPPYDTGEDPSLASYVRTDYGSASFPSGIQPDPPAWDVLLAYLQPAARVLDLGSGVGGSTYGLAQPNGFTLGLELRSGRVREAVARPEYLSAAVDFAVGNACDPPLTAYDWDAVALLNLYDVVERPDILLGQASALLRPDGLLLCASPYQFTGEFKPPSPAADLRTRLGTGSSGAHYVKVLETERLWVLQDNERRWFAYSLDVILGRKLS